MSWEIFIHDLPDVPSIHDVPKGHVPGNIGSRAELEKRIHEVVPYAETQDEWMFARRPGIDLSIQFHNGPDGLVRYILVHVHEGEQSASCVAAIVQHLGLRAIDTATGEFFDPISLDESL